MNGVAGLALQASLVGLCLTLGAGPTAGQPAPTGGPTATATFAGGCFWCMEPPFDELDGVISTTSGYTGGSTKNPTYEQVSAGRTGRTEAIQIVYDPSKVAYAKLLEVFWRNVDAVDGDGQFCDRGPQYRPGIFHHSADQQKAAEASRERIAAQLAKPIPVEIAAATEFYKAEGYHQDYYKKNPVRYKFYKWNCGREQRLSALWGKVSAQ
ncbi:MAG: peptide-methionine (S)-S-oxide reductase MsrA [Luteitalea sp.]